MTLSSLQILYGLTSAANAKNKSLLLSYLDPEVQVQIWCPFPLLLYGQEGVIALLDEHFKEGYFHVQVYFDEAVQVDGKLTAPLTFTSSYLSRVPKLQREGAQARIIIELSTNNLVKFIWFKMADPDREMLIRAILPAEIITTSEEREAWLNLGFPDTEEKSHAFSPSEEEEEEEVSEDEGEDLSPV